MDSRSTPTISRSLEGHSCSKKYIKHYKRLYDSICKKTSSDSLLKRDLHKIPDTLQQSDVSRDFQNGRLRSLETGSPVHVLGSCVKDVFGTQTGWIQSTNLRSEKVKQILKPATISSSQSFHSTRVPTETRLHGKTGSFASVFPCPGKRNTSAFSGFKLPRPALLHDLPAVRSVDSSNHLLENLEFSSDPASKKRHKVNCLLRRFSSCKPRCSATSEGSRFHRRILNRLRMESKFKKICIRSSSRHRVSRHWMEDKFRQKVCSQQEDSHVEKRSSNANKCKNMELAASQIYSWKLKLHSICGSSGSIALPSNPDRQQSSPRSYSETKVSDSSQSNSRSGMVVRQSKSRIGYIHKTSRGFPNDRCFKHRVGSSHPGPVNQRFLDKTAEFVAHKSKRIVCSMHSDNVVQRKIEEQNDSDSVRQSNCHCLCEESGRHQVPCAAFNGGIATSVGRTKSYTYFDKIHSGNLQLRCRPSFSSEDNPRLALEQCDYSDSICKMGDPVGGSIRYQDFQGGSLLHLPVSRGSGSSIHRRFQSPMEFRNSLGVSPSIPHTQNFTSPKHGRRSVLVNNSELAPSILAPRFAQESITTGFSNSGSASSSDRHVNGAAATSGQPTSFAGMEDSGWLRLTHGWSSDDVSLLETGNFKNIFFSLEEVVTMGY